MSDWAWLGAGCLAGFLLFVFGVICGVLSGAHRADPFNPRSAYRDRPGGEM